LENGTLIRKVAVPMEFVPIAMVLFNLAQFSPALMVFLPMSLLLFRVTVWFFPLLGLHFLFTIGLSVIISMATVFYRDVRAISSRSR
jgi:ABC-type polysaccharide/polyol phosphate export permease